VNERIDTLALAIESEIPRFFDRWDLDPADWSSEVARLREFADVRPDLVRGHFVEFFGLEGTATLTLQAEGGQVLLEEVPVPLGAEAELALVMFTGVPMKLAAVPDSGRDFAEWSDGVTDAERTLTLAADQSLTALFD
jgi:hypothetical protein